MSDEEKVRFPDAVVRLSGEDGNTGAIMGRVARALKQAGATQDEIMQYRDETLSGDYENVLQTAMRWVTVE